MNIFLGLVGLYVAVGIVKCMSAPDGTGYLSAGCPTAIGAGTAYPNGMPSGCTTAPSCSNKSFNCVLLWPLWNSDKCNTNF